ncbi:MAG: PAS domain S-box protein [Sedimentisphaerales bacterium]|nr:PAS domain S-box protein [Sedimentisphaerales bacterium]
MTDQKKTKAELISELVELRETVAELKKSEAQLKQAEKELPESKAKYRDLLDNLSAITYIGTLDPNSTTLYISPQIENILGVSVSDFNADPDLWEKMLHPEDRERFTTEALHYHSKREPYALEYRMITKDGDEIYVYDNGWIVEDNNGKPLYRQSVISDITNRKQAEKELRESEAKYRLLFETAKDAIFISDEKGKFIDVNQAACELLGYSKEEFMELTIKDIDPEGYEQFIKVRDGHVKDAMFEVNHRRKDGTVFPVEISGAFFVSHGQRMSLAIARDISARKQAEAAVSHERDKLTAILDSMADGVYIVNQKYDIEYINPTIQKEFGPIDGRKCYEYLHNLKAVCPWCKIKDVFAGKTVRWEWYSVKSNKTYDLLDTRLTNVDGSMSKLEIFRDITERKQVEEKIKAYQEQLQSLASEISATEERQRRQFATDLHDNIGQLLAVINIKLGSVRKMVPPGEMAELLNEINRLILKAFHCTQSLTHELYPPILYKLGLEPAVEGLLENLEKEHGIAYRFETKGESKQLDNDISSLLYRAVRELLINITKYAKADEVQVSIRKQGEQIKISVEDNGVGFDTSQVKPTSKQAKGFGLFSIRERLSYQGGKLDIESVIGRGTRVTITAPLTMTI